MGLLPSNHLLFCNIVDEENQQASEVPRDDPHSMTMYGKNQDPIVPAVAWEGGGGIGSEPVTAASR